ncbi:cache domain-containing sensor histidine kinase [Cohnella fermenti]|uniref:cache domain-containing sensor histidine kinase n=1 Tax=Cohnella fermenti TaxID=2565925 RepID=UPI001454DCE3|nr:sensor histidine kinase [Cohnella fermenti]
MLGWIRRKIQYKLFLLYALVISIPIVLFGGISYGMSTRMLEKEYLSSQQKLNKQIVKTIEENIRNLTRQSMALYANMGDIAPLLANSQSGRNTEYVARSNQVSNYLYSLLQSNDKLYAITLLTLKGDVLFYGSKQGGSLNLLNSAGEPWFVETLALQGMPLLIEPHTQKYVSSSSANPPVLSISRTVIDLTTGVELGMVVFDQLADQLSSAVADIDWEPNQSFAVVGQSGDVIYSYGSLKPTVYEALAESSQGGRSGSYSHPSDSGNLLVNYSESTDYGWKVISAIPMSELRQKSEFLRDINVYLLIVLLSFAFVLSLCFSYIVIRPLKKLLRSLRRLGQGDLRTRIEIRGEDELGQIGRTFNDMVGNIEKLIEQNLRIGMLKKQAQLEALQSQINPHFLFNTLSSIMAVLDKKEFEQSSTMIKSLSNQLRYSLNKGKFVVPFREELENIRNYLYIQDCRFGSKYRVQYDIDEDVLDYGIVRLSLQPLVENALIHGIEPKIGQALLKITARTFGQLFYVYISDTGVGIDPGRLKEINDALEESDEDSSSVHDRIGIVNVDRRIRMFFGPNYGLKLYIGSHRETVVKLTLPAHRHVPGLHPPQGSPEPSHRWEGTA